MRNPPIQPNDDNVSPAIKKANEAANTGSSENTRAVRVAVVNLYIAVCIKKV